MSPGQHPAAGGRARSTGCLPVSSLRSEAVLDFAGHSDQATDTGKYRRAQGLTLPGLACGWASLLCFFWKGRWWHVPDGGDLSCLRAPQTSSVGGGPGPAPGRGTQPVGVLWDQSGPQLPSLSSVTVGVLTSWPPRKSSRLGVPALGHSKASDGGCLWSQLCKVANIGTQVI